MSWADDEDEFPPLGAAAPVNKARQRIVELIPPSQPSVASPSSQDANDEVLSDEHVKPRLDRKHGFLRVIERNQTSRRDYEVEMREQTEARERHLAEAQAKQRYSASEHESWRRESTKDEAGRVRNFAYRRSAEQPVTPEVEQWGQSRREWFERQKKLEEERKLRKQRPDVAIYRPPKRAPAIPEESSQGSQSRGKQDSVVTSGATGSGVLSKSATQPSSTRERAAVRQPKPARQLYVVPARKPTTQQQCEENVR